MMGLKDASNILAAARRLRVDTGPHRYGALKCAVALALTTIDIDQRAGRQLPEWTAKAVDALRAELARCDEADDADNGVGQ